jgi:hypothetical protein
MTAQLMAYCGLDCSGCPAYIATQANNIAKLTSLAQEWLEGSTDHTLMLCDGCLASDRTADVRIMQWCAKCPTRTCVMERGLENCAHCEDYGCQHLLMVFNQSADAKTNLDRIRAAL